MKIALRVLVLVAGVGFMAPVAAQDRMTQELCEGSWAAVATMAGLHSDGIDVRSSVEGWCVVEDAVFPTGTTLRAQIETLRWRGSDVARLVESDLPPRAVEIYGDGLIVAPNTGRPSWDYLYGLQMDANPMGFGLSMRWDGVQNSLSVDEAFYDFGTHGRVEFTARVEGLDLTNMIALQSSLGSVGVRDLSVRSEFSGWFETFALLPVGSALLDDGEVAPAAQVEAYRQQAIDFMDLIPEDVLSATSREAVAGFVRALPVPRGVAQLQVRAEPTIGVARAVPFMGGGPVAEALDPALAGVSVAFSWDSEEDE